MEAREIRRQALARVEARRWPPEYHEALPGRMTGRIQVDHPEFYAPASAAEWWDDRMARTTTQRNSGVLFAIADAARGGAKAAVAAVAAARSLNPWHQWWTWQALNAWESWPGGIHVDAAPVMRAVAREWRRLGLAAEMPDDPLPVVTVNAADLQASAARRKAGNKPVHPRPACLSGLGWGY
jgi:hypothetical protein